MKRITFFILLSFSFLGFSQTISLKGKTEREFKNQLQIKSIFNSEYNADVKIDDSVSVVNNEFAFKIPKTRDTFYYPYQFIEAISSQSFYNSSFFFLGSNDEVLSINKENFKVDYLKETSIAKDFKKYRAFIGSIENEKENAVKPVREAVENYGRDNIPKETLDVYFATLDKLEVKENYMKKEFVKTNPNSIVGFWEMVLLFQSKGYSDVFDDLESVFSLSIKKQNAAKIFFEKLRNGRLLKDGVKFPSAKLKTINQEPIDLVFPKAQYTLVDFWFSSCVPCLQEIPKLKDLYKEYQPKGFEIVSIGTDQTKYVKNLQKVISERGLTWKNFYDENGKQSTQWGVSSFPTKYLLDEHGVILKKNPSLEEVEELLKVKLKN